MKKIIVLVLAAFTALLSGCTWSVATSSNVSVASSSDSQPSVSSEATSSAVKATSIDDTGAVWHVSTKNVQPVVKYLGTDTSAKFPSGLKMYNCKIIWGGLEEVKDGSGWFHVARRDDSLYVSFLVPFAGDSQTKVVKMDELGVYRICPKSSEIARIDIPFDELSTITLTPTYCYPTASETAEPITYIDITHVKSVKGCRVLSLPYFLLDEDYTGDLFNTMLWGWSGYVV